MEHEAYERGVEACIRKGKALHRGEFEMLDVACGLCGLHRCTDHVGCRIDTPRLTCGTHDICEGMRQDPVPISDIEHTRSPDRTSLRANASVQLRNRFPSPNSEH